MDRPFSFGRLARLCLVTYGIQPYWEIDLEALGYVHINSLVKKVTSTEALVCGVDRELVIAIRGTQQIRDWVTNLTPGTCAENGIRRGFAEAAESIADDIVQTINFSGAERVIVTGHSLGGAVAHALCRLLAFDRLIHEFHTFAAPRVGNPLCAELISAVHYESTSWSHNNDIVPRLPPADWGYSHVGQWRYIDHAGLVHHNPESSLVLGDRFKGRVLAISEGRLTDGLDDHAIEHYIRAADAEDRKRG
jgi:pimeloyl-ACP methyl ester carboxylesterase